MQNLLFDIWIQRKNFLRSGCLSVRLFADRVCVFRNAARRRTVAAVSAAFLLDRDTEIFAGLSTNYFHHSQKFCQPHTIHFPAPQSFLTFTAFSSPLVRSRRRKLCITRFRRNPKTRSRRCGSSFPHSLRLCGSPDDVVLAILLPVSMNFGGGYSVVEVQWATKDFS